MQTNRACYVASRVFCPMVAAERDGDLCLRCIYFEGVLTDTDRLAFMCSWSPKDRNADDPLVRMAASKNPRRSGGLSY